MQVDFLEEKCYYNRINSQVKRNDNNNERKSHMEKRGYREIMLQYIKEQEPEDLILTEKAAEYAAASLGLSKDAVKKAVNVNMARLEKADILVRVAKGVYCRKIKTVFGYYVPNKETLFSKQLLKDENDIIGYETGLSALNKIGLVSQMPNRRYIATNLHTKHVPEGIQIEIRKPRTMINAANYRYLQLLDAIHDLDEAPVDAANPVQVLRGAAKELKLNTDKLILFARKYYNQKTLLKTIDIFLEGVYETAR